MVEFKSPLEWPDGLPRTEDRKFGRFNYRAEKNRYGYCPKRDITWSKACERVAAELDRIGAAEGTVTTDAKAYVSGEGIRAGENPDDPGVALYFTDEDGARRVIACDEYTKGPQNLAAIAAVLDAMRAIERHGGASVYGAAMSGFRARLPEHGSGPAWWDVLGVRRDDDPALMKRAYRIRCRLYHPDTGTEASGDKWRDLQDAWRQAKDAVEGLR